MQDNHAQKMAKKMGNESFINMGGDENSPTKRQRTSQRKEKKGNEKKMSFHLSWKPPVRPDLLPVLRVLHTKSKESSLRLINSPSLLLSWFSFNIPSSTRTRDWSLTAGSAFASFFSLKMKRNCWQFQVAAQSTVEQGVKAVTNSRGCGCWTRDSSSLAKIVHSSSFPLSDFLKSIGSAKNDPSISWG